MRNVVTISHLDPELQQWLRDEAHRRTEETGTRVHSWQLVNTAIQEFRERQDHNNNNKAEEVSDADKGR